MKFNGDAHNKFCSPWKDHLIIKLLGGNHSYRFLLHRLQQKWALKVKGQCQLIDLETIILLLDLPTKMIEILR